MHACIYIHTYSYDTQICMPLVTQIRVRCSTTWCQPCHSTSLSYDTQVRMPSVTQIPVRHTATEWTVSQHMFESWHTNMNAPTNPYIYEPWSLCLNVKSHKYRRGISQSVELHPTRVNTWYDTLSENKKCRCPMRSLCMIGAKLRKLSHTYTLALSLSLSLSLFLSLSHTHTHTHTLNTPPVPYVWHDSFIYVTWRIHMCGMTHSCVWHGSFICVTWLTHMCDTFTYDTGSVVGRCLNYTTCFICVAWLIHMREMLYPYVWYG